jgi:hypothetical protein
MSPQNRIIGFLRSIGLTIEQRSLPDATVLPGISVEGGSLSYDPEKLAYPGDLLHEAGHLAVVPAAERQAFGADVGGDGGFEMAAIAWSYAACVFLGLPVETVFHEGGYRGGSASLRENFSNGHYFGVSILEWLGMTVQHKAKDGEVAVYPAMRRWLCE